ncbi:hypothetical protein BB560_004004 [Smittium megazygosporum]|uniref:Uncharacterized protein n=1 Tax=Smittium megazygosporum TaxID=133381 RepID=A0A2T9ZAH1_9FUNG|nr:hypothetical protein BB560_004004 [Smittium megazygosporum]
MLVYVFFSAKTHPSFGTTQLDSFCNKNFLAFVWGFLKFGYQYSASSRKHFWAAVTFPASSQWIERLPPPQLTSSFSPLFFSPYWPKSNTDTVSIGKALRLLTLENKLHLLQPVL